MRRCALLLTVATWPRTSAWTLAPNAATPLAAAPVRRRSSAPPQLMFSGIVEEMGTVRRLEKVARVEQWDGSVGEGWELEIDAAEALGQASLGCSIAVNGVCLTVTEFTDDWFRVGLAPETMRRTNMVSLEAGDAVNLERALPADGRNSGHFVQGHVDDVGEIVEMRPDGDSLYVTVRPPSRLLPYIVPKGFIAIDGTSLTVCEVDYTAGTFNFMLIAFTQQKVIIPKKEVSRRSDPYRLGRKRETHDAMPPRCEASMSARRFAPQTRAPLERANCLRPEGARPEGARQKRAPAGVVACAIDRAVWWSRGWSGR